MAEATEELALSERGSVMFEDPDKAKETGEDSPKKRQQWSGKLEFILSVVGYSVGLGNLWRFSYLCHKNGGGAFLIPYLVFLFICAIPLCFLEMVLGQFSGTSSVGVWTICPLFKGLGYSMVIISSIASIFNKILIAWVLYYLFQSFKDELPWLTCKNWWNSENCVSRYITSNDTEQKPKDASNITGDSLRVDADNVTDRFKAISAEEEFWQFGLLRMTSGIEYVGYVEWHLVVVLLIGWVVNVLCLIKGTKSMGKVIYVTAGLPYVLMLAFLVRSLLLPGSTEGILYYVTPDFSKLLDLQIWIEALLQVFYSLGVSWGGIITMASYNDFRSDCFRNAIICTLVDGFTSVFAGFVTFAFMGFIADQTGMHVSQVLKTGPGVAVVTYSGAVGSLPFPQIWAVLFYIMLFLMAIDSQFATFKTSLSFVFDEFPKFRQHKTLTLLGLSFIGFSLGLPLTSQAGIYIYQIYDWYLPTFSLILIGFLECIAVGWIYGATNFSRDIQLMTGKVAWTLIKVCWCFIVPALLLVMFVFTVATYEPPIYGDYHYPYWAQVFGIFLALLPIIPIPVVFFVNFCRVGWKLEKIKELLKPAPGWGPASAQYKLYLERPETIRYSGSCLDFIKTTVCRNQNIKEICL